MGVATTGTSSTRGIRQAAADTRGLRALEQVAIAVVKQFPRQAEQECRGFPSDLRVGLGGAGFQRRIDVNGETAPGVRVDRAQAFMTFAVCATGIAASCRSRPHFTRFSSTFRARSRK